MSPTFSSRGFGAGGGAAWGAEGAATTGRGGAGGRGFGGGITIGFGAGLGAGLALATFGFAALGLAAVFFTAGLRAFGFADLAFAFALAFGFAFGRDLAFAAFRFGAFAFVGLRVDRAAFFFAGLRADFFAVLRAGFFAAFFTRAVDFLRAVALRGLAFFGALDFFAFAFVFDDFFEAVFRGLAVFAMALPHLPQGSICAV